MSLASRSVTPRSGIALIGFTACGWRSQRTMFSGVHTRDETARADWRALDRVEPERPDMVSKAIAPDLAFGNDGAYIGNHSSWNRRPPSGMGSIGERSAYGYESENRWSPSLLTRLGDSAARRNNEMGRRTV